MSQADWLMKQFQFLPKELPKIVQHAEEPRLDVTDEITGERYSIPLKQYLLELILKLKLNQGEDSLFAQRAKLSDTQLAEFSAWFYDKLADLTDAELEQAQFSRVEIEQGRIDIQQTF